MVARAERAELRAAALAGAIGHLGGVGAVEAAVRLGVLDVVGRAEPVLFHHGRCALGQDPVEPRSLQVERTALAGAGGHAAGDLVGELHAALLTQVVGRERRGEQADAAVDVVAHAAGRDDSVRGLGRRQAADREAVALVDVGHRQARLDDPRQRGDVLELLERVVGSDRVEQLGIGEDAGGDEHVVAGAGGDLPEGVVDSAEVRHRGSRWRATSDPSDGGMSNGGR